MTIAGREYNFLLTVKARRELRALCPGGDIAKLSEYMDGPEMEEHIAEVVMLMSRGYEEYKAYWEPDYEPHPIEEDLLIHMTMEDYRILQSEVLDALRRGMGITVETEEPKTKGKKSTKEEKPS